MKAMNVAEEEMAVLTMDPMNDDEATVGLPSPHPPGTTGKSFLDVEIDRQCDGQLLCQAVGDEIATVGYRDAPPFLQHNRFVRRGYRALLPFSGCVQSLFTWTNESVNIWSHLLGFILFFLLTIYDNLIALPNIKSSTTDHVIISLGLLCFQFCMLCSTGYHVFNCHSERASRRWLMVDIAGICIGLVGCYIPAVHFAFYCKTIWRDVYLILIVLLCACVLIVQLNPRYISRNPNHYWSHRIVLFVALVGYGLLPVGHWIRLNGGWQNELVQLFAPKIAAMYLMGVVALLVYLTRMPERCLPGKVDYIGSSHQLWHVLVVLAFLYWHNAGYEFLLYRAEGLCSGVGT